MNALKHFNTITQHKLLVMRYCFKAGLYRQGLLHDLSKYSPTEFLAGARYYQGTCSPNNAQRNDHGYSAAWLHHKGRNRHHFEYWTDYQLGAPTGTISPVPMPKRYVAEMFCDRIAASQIYSGKDYTPQIPLDYFLRGKDHMMAHPTTKRQLEGLLRMYLKYGEEKTFWYIRNRFLR